MDNDLCALSINRHFLADSKEHMDSDRNMGQEKEKIGGQAATFNRN